MNPEESELTPEHERVLRSRLKALLNEMFRETNVERLQVLQKEQVKLETKLGDRVISERKRKQLAQMALVRIGRDADEEDASRLDQLDKLCTRSDSGSESPNGS